MSHDNRFNAEAKKERREFLIDMGFAVVVWFGVSAWMYWG